MTFHHIPTHETMTDTQHRTTAARMLSALLALRGGGAAAGSPATCGIDDSMSEYHGLRGSSKSTTGKVLVKEYRTLMRRRGSWRRADAQSGGLLGWAMQEMGIDYASDASDADDTASETLHSAHLGSPTTTPHGAPGSARWRLTGDEAVAIYLVKLGPMPGRAAGRLAREFGITAKAVRDVWTGRTWQAATTRVHAQQQHNDFLPLGVVSRGAVAAAARVTRAL